MTLLDGYLRDLTREGQSVSEGAFTISAAEARRKLAEYQHAAPDRYILLLISSAVSGGAGFIEVVDDRKGLSIAFDGNTYTAQDFGRLYQRIFAGSVGAETTLGIGLAALGDRASVTSVSDQGTARWKVGKNDDVVEDCLDTGPPLTTISISKPDKAWSFLRTLRGYAGLSSEARLVDSLCEHALIPININNQVVNRPVQLGNALAVSIGGDIKASYQSPLTIELAQPEPDVRFALALGPGRLEAVVHGVSFALSTSFGVRGVVWHNELRTDISHTDLAQDATYDELCRFVVHFRSEALLKAARMIESLPAEYAQQLISQISTSVEENNFPKNLDSEVMLRLIRFLAMEPSHRRIRAHLMLACAERFKLNGQLAQATSLFSDSYYLLKEVLRLEKLDVSVVYWTIKALYGIGADTTTICDWTLLGASTALAGGQDELARTWYKSLLELSESAERDGDKLKVAAILGLSTSENDIEHGFNTLLDMGQEVPELRLVLSKEPSLFRTALVLYQRQLSCRYREDIHHILETNGYLRP